MSKHDHLRQGGAFPGGLVNALDDLDARITALEKHGPMLAELQPHFEAQQAAKAEIAAADWNNLHSPGGKAPEAPEPEPAPGPMLVPDPAAQPEPEPVTEPEPADPSVQSLESQQEPEDGAQGGQS